MNRPMGTEAAAGKNPVSHVGKIYNVLAHEIARMVYGEVEGLKEVYILLLSRIGTPINNPQMASAQVLTNGKLRIHDVSQKITAIIERELAISTNSAWISARENIRCADVLHSLYEINHGLQGTQGRL